MQPPVILARTAADFEEIGPEEHFDNFLSSHLTRPYSGNQNKMGGPRHRGIKKKLDFSYLPWVDLCNHHQSEWIKLW